MKEKIIIQNLEKQQSNYTSPESAQNQANSLESLSSDIYTDSKRFIYELIQNADDASSNSGKLEISIKIIEDYLIVSHQGEKFSEIDIESICSVGDGNKKGDLNKTGFKGIGFKSVFSHSDCVKINSGGYCFKFDRLNWGNYWNKDWGDQNKWQKNRDEKGKEAFIKMPWQIIPIWSKIEEDLSFVKSYNVSTIIKYKDTSKLEKELFELFSDTNILLFLRSQNVRIIVEGKTSFSIEKIKEGNTVKLLKKNQILSEWLLKSFTFNVDTATSELIKNDLRVPKKLRSASKTEISIAVQVKNGKIKSIKSENRLIFTYLPTSVNYNFPFLVNASFVTDAGRQHIHEDLKWNTWLLNQIPIKLFEWLAELTDTTFKSEILKLIPQKFTNISSKLEQSFNEGFDKALNKIAFLPNEKNKLLKVSNTIFDETDISKFLDPKMIVDFVNSNKNTKYETSSFISKLEPVSTLFSLGVQKFDIDDLIKFLESSIFTSNHKRKENFSLITFFKKQSDSFFNKDERKNWNEKLRDTPFIFDNDKKLKSPKHIYFPSIEFSNTFSDDLSVIHPKTMVEIESNPEIKQWLDDLGVKEPSDISFIEKTIIDDKDYVTKENAIAVGRYLFKAHQKGLINNLHYHRLKTIKILTKQNSLVNAINSYLSDFYEPKLEIEELYDNDFYVSEAYYKESELISEWKTFFIKIGVSQSIEKKRIRDVWINELQSFGIDEDYVEEGVQGAKNHPDYNEYPIHLIYDFTKISFIELAIQPSFSVIFWKELMNKYSPSDFDSTPNLPLGHYNGYHFLQDYNLWAIKNLAIFPSRNNRCYEAKNIFLNTEENIHLCGKYLPVLNYDGDIPEDWLNILDFKEHLNLEDYLSILSSIWKEKDKKLLAENKQIINEIYEIISKKYLSNTKKLEDWAKSNKLLAKDGKTFFAPNKLSVVTVEGFKDQNLALCDEKNKKVIDLLNIFGVTIIDKVKPHISNSQTEIQDLKKQLNHILPLIAVVSVVESKILKDWETEYNSLKNKLKNIRFIETTEIWLSYGNDGDEQKRSSWAEANDFYYVGNWYKPRVLDSLIKPVSKFLKIEYAKRHLYVLLSDNFKEGLEYIKEKFGEEMINLIPDYLLNPDESESIIPNANNRDYNQTDKDLGCKGELFVFEQLKIIYSDKYNQEVSETDEGFKIGSDVTVIWRNKESESTSDHDFKVTEGEKDIYIDSKATPHSRNAEKIAFYISPNEFSLMESVDKYLIARVFNVTSKPNLKFIKMDIHNLN